MSVNKVIILGTVGQDPSEHTFPNGDKQAKFSIATSEKYTTKDGQKVENTEWHNIVANRAQAEIALKYVKKGNQLYIEGKLKTTEYTNKELVKQKITQIICENIQLLGGKKSESDKNDLNVPPPPQPIVSDNSDDLPF
jgi:single-strand DNA-binding protein